MSAAVDIRIWHIGTPAGLPVCFAICDNPVRYGALDTAQSGTGPAAIVYACRDHLDGALSILAKRALGDAR